MLNQLADAKDVMDAVKNLEGVRLPVLTPNLKVGTNYDKKFVQTIYILWNEKFNILYN